MSNGGNERFSRSHRTLPEPYRREQDETHLPACNLRIANARRMEHLGRTTQSIGSIKIRNNKQCWIDATSLTWPDKRTVQLLGCRCPCCTLPPSICRSRRCPRANAICRPPCQWAFVQDFGSDPARGSADSGAVSLYRRPKTAPKSGAVLKTAPKWRHPKLKVRHFEHVFHH